MIARLLQLLPSTLTGRVRSKAAATVRKWIGKNPEVQRLRYSWPRRLLIWGSEHPTWFTVVCGCAWVLVTLLITCAPTYWPAQLPFRTPRFSGSTDPGGYLGVPWTIQATLVALVYPIVVSFVAMLLQRRAHASVALRVYLLDSAVVPAGAASIGLLLAMGIQFFALPYLGDHEVRQHLAAYLVFNGTWLGANVLLTGLFLARTVRFIQDEESRYSISQVAVNVVLRAELKTAAAQHILLSASEKEWGLGAGGACSSAPSVDFVGWNQGAVEVSRMFQSPHALEDVHLNILRLVAWSWLRRARTTAQAEPPVLSFPVRFGHALTGNATLCTVDHGPSLGWLERQLVRWALVYRPTRASARALSTGGVLREAAGAVESLVEQRRHGLAVAAMDEFIALHVTLLQSCASLPQAAIPNVAMVNADVYSLGNRSFAASWTEPYVDVARAAVDSLNDNGRLFRRIAYAPRTIARALPAHPAALATETLKIGATVAYQLSAWWKRAGPKPPALREPALVQTYENAVIDFVGGWNSFEVRLARSDEPDAVCWSTIAARAKAYARHLDESARLFVDSVAAGDEVAATWLYEHFLKWWGNRASNLTKPIVTRDIDTRHAHMSLAELSWEEVTCVLRAGAQPVNLQVAEKAMAIALRDYWEAVRFYLVVLLVHKAGDAPPPDSGEIRYAAALLQQREFKPGARVVARNLDSFDAVLLAALKSAFGDTTMRSSIDELADKLDGKGQEARVALWVYTWDGGSLELSSMTAAITKVLVALAGAVSHAHSQQFIESKWRNVGELAEIDRHLERLAELIRSDAFPAMLPAVDLLQTMLGIRPDGGKGRDLCASALSQLQRVAKHERTITFRAMQIDAEAIARIVSQIAVAAFQMDRFAAGPVKKLAFVSSAPVEVLTVSMSLPKEDVRDGAAELSSFSYVQPYADEVRRRAIGYALVTFLRDSDSISIPRPVAGVSGEPSGDDARIFLESVVQRCSVLYGLGQVPVVLVGDPYLATLLDAHHWGYEPWRTAPPTGIRVRSHDQATQEDAMSYINDVPVYEVPTPNGDCYVVMEASVSTLQIQGQDAPGALKFSWAELGDDQVEVGLKVRIWLGPVDGQH